ncbi:MULTISPECIES: NADH oxidase [Streptomyces]|uniref:NADH oxidase n=2 Tax=Streptomyces TaxID=1883 RepID=A0A2U9P0Z4_STRAS|nr:MULTISPECIES: NADH oxidase [Streptomyces]AWT43329.1 NADH oxidase [Streptomyces actuosus]MBM4824503.1 NADH oxidase [Streptomyces actuosus]
MGSRTLHLWALREDVVVRTDDDGSVVLSSGRFGTERIAEPDRIVREMLRRMELGPVRPANVEVAPGRPAPQAWVTGPVLPPALAGLSRMVIRTLGMDDLKGPLLSVTPVAADATFAPDGVPGHPLRLPRDARMASAPAGLVLASARSKHEVVLHRPEAAWVAAMLAWPVTAQTAAAALPLPHTVVHDVLGYLVAAGMAVPADG